MVFSVHVTYFHIYSFSILKKNLLFLFASSYGINTLVFCSSVYIWCPSLQEMSYNNYLDADAAWNCVSESDSPVSPTCVVVKHTNPCGVASQQDILEAYRLAVKADPVSAFGGIVAFNTTIDGVYRPDSIPKS
jgi:hypothetical protein